jgi:hypothetical protein
VADAPVAIKAANNTGTRPAPQRLCARQLFAFVHSRLADDGADAHQLAMVFLAPSFWSKRTRSEQMHRIHRAD